MSDYETFKYVKEHTKERLKILREAAKTVETPQVDNQLTKARETIKKMAEALRQADALITEITPELSDAPKYPDKWHEQYDITQALALAEPYLRGK